MTSGYFYKGKHRAPTHTGRNIATTSAAVGIALVGVQGSAEAASDSTWDKLAQCESGGNWAINTGNGFSGGLQFTPGTWTGFGGAEFAPSAYKASRAEQIVVAERVLAGQGWGAWPACSRKLGLRGEPSTKRAAPSESSSRDSGGTSVRQSRSATPVGSSKSTARTYRVRAGDTLSKIAQAKHVEGGWRKLAAINDIKNANRIYVGDVIRLR